MNSKRACSCSFSGSRGKTRSSRCEGDGAEASGVAGEESSVEGAVVSEAGASVDVVQAREAEDAGADEAEGVGSVAERGDRRSFKCIAATKRFTDP